MATLTPALSLTMDYSSTGTSTGSLVVSVNDTLTTASPHINLARNSIVVGSVQELIASNAADMYIYIKAISSDNGSDILRVSTGSTVCNMLRLGPGEFLFARIASSNAIKIEAIGGTIVIEYGYWTKG